MSAARVLAALFAVAAAHHLWNAFTVPPLTGFDAPAHAGYVLTLLDEGRLPHPYQGWSTFHPPLYYLLGAGLWWSLEPLGPHAVLAGLRLPGVFASLLVGAVACWALRRWGHPIGVVAAATALVLFVPVAQLSAAMVGNEMLAAGLVSLALGAALRLQQDPADARAAALAGVAAGLAVATKYTAGLAVAAAATPFVVVLLRTRRLDRRVMRAALVFGLAVTALGAPTYARNVWLTGVLLPVTRDYDPMRGLERTMVLRERRLLDFAWVPPGCLRRPSFFHVEGREGSFDNRNPVMASIWCLTYAGAWNDVFAHRIPVREHRDERWLGPGLAALGLVPTAVMLFGFGAALRELWRRRGASADAPLVVIGLLGLAMHVAIAAAAPSAGAVKASYLLGLGVPAAAFYARAAARLRPRARAAVLSLSILAAGASALAFTNGLLFPPERLSLRVWSQIATQLPYSHIMEALHRLALAWHE